MQADVVSDIQPRKQSILLENHRHRVSVALERRLPDLTLGGTLKARQ